MKALRLAAIAALTLASPAAFALEPVTVSVIGVTQVGSGSVSTQQNSTMNFVGMYQNGANVKANVQQSGLFNSASIAQRGTTSATAIVGQKGFINASNLTQIGPKNLAGIGQAGSFNFNSLSQRLK
jgi:hypothetical protein